MKIGSLVRENALSSPAFTPQHYLALLDGYGDDSRTAEASKKKTAFFTHLLWIMGRIHH